VETVHAGACRKEYIAPLYTSVKFGQQAVIRLLLEKGAMPNFLDGDRLSWSLLSL